MRELTIRAIADKTTNRLVIVDVTSGRELHVYPAKKTLTTLSPAQLVDQEDEAIRDFLVNGRHDDDEQDDDGW